MQDRSLSFNEKVTFALRALYDRYGYTRYKMGKFEEYDLYARNKDFLVSDSVITFTDTNGKLMALKPDVTLSIVKNSKDTPDTVQKLYYTENVYRVTKGAHAFKELMQVGLECLGNIDNYCISEVLLLAAESLGSISGSSVLDISHLGLLSEVMEGVGIPKESRAEILRYIGEKNQHELAAACSALGVSEESIQILRQLASLRGAPEQVLPMLKNQFPASAALKQLEQVCTALTDSPVAVCIDFSVVDDIHYYNGIVFKGFIRGIAESVLSGGQYDKLMQKLKRKAGAIGFAVYMDLLERMEQTRKQYDVDVLLLYEQGTQLQTIRQQIKSLAAKGYSVMVQPAVPENIKYKQLMKISTSGVEILENNA